MWTPATALLWECWRLSRRRLAVMIFAATLGGAGLIVSPLDGASLALGLAGLLAWFGQGWTVTVNSQKGFAMVLGFARPIPTRVLVIVPLAYVAISSAATFLAPMIVLRAAFGIPFPLLQVATLVSTFCVVVVAATWWTGDPVRRRLVPTVLWMLGWFWFATRVLRSEALPALSSFSASAYGWMAFISAAAFGVTIAGVARQRRGDDEFGFAQPAGQGGVAPKRPTFYDRIGGRLRVQCPVSSPTRAQLWFEMYSVGGRVLTTGALVALAAPFVMTIRSASGVRGEGLLSWLLIAWMVPFMAGLPSMLGVSRKQGSAYLSSFAATRALGTAHLVALKVLVTSLTLLVAWVAIGTIVWVFAVPLAAWGPVTQATFADYYPSLPSTAYVLPIIVSVGVYFAAAVAAVGTVHAFLVLNGRRVAIAGLGFGLYVAAWVLVGVRGWVDGDTIGNLHVWIVTGTVVLGTAYLLRRSIAERIFTSRVLLLVLGIWVGFTLMVQLLNTELNDGFYDRLAFVVLALLPLSAALLAPWSFSRLRHR